MHQIDETKRDDTIYIILQYNRMRQSYPILSCPVLSYPILVNMHDEYSTVV